MKTKLYLIGVLLLSLVIVSSCKKKSDSNPAPVANFSFTGDGVPPPATVTFSNLSLNATSYSWNFGDGSAASSSASPQHTYTAAGGYTVTLSATGAGGSNTISKFINVPAPTPTSLTITVTNDVGNPSDAASVYLYASQSDFNNRTNQVGSTGTTDATGKVTFSDNMGTVKYYFWVEKGCLNNVRGTTSTTNALSGNANTTATVHLAQSGTLQLQSGSTNPYEVYINGVDVTSVGGYATKNFYYQPTGSVTVRVLQLSGYVFYPTDETFTPTISCGQTAVVAFP